MGEFTADVRLILELLAAVTVSSFLMCFCLLHHRH